MTTTMTDAALYRLLAWSSPGYPTGAFSYSHGLELRREVSVADVPGESDERSRIRRRDLDELFRRGFHAHYPPILES